MTQEQRDWIDDSDYETLLQKWRFGEIADSLFIGDTGKYFAKVMFGKKAALGHDEAVATSKRIGWNL
jgi:hypothetical protein